MEITELTVIDDIERLEERYCKTFGAKPLNVSWWNPSENLKFQLLNCLNLHDLTEKYDPIDYHFSYDHGSKKKLIESFGLSSETKSCLITPTGSTSLLCVINWIKEKKNGTIHTLSPHYFSVSYNTNSLGMSLEKHYIERDKNGYTIGSIECAQNDVIWLTNPIYCTGVTYTEKCKNLIRKKLGDGITIVADECLASTGQELSHEFGDYENFIGIYCPHKSVCMNGIKFSVIVYDKSHEDFFDQWSDILYGCLGISNAIAIDHFLSPNFHEYETFFQKKIDDTWKYVKQMVKQYPNVEYDKMSSGYLRTLFIPKLDAQQNSDLNTLWDVIRSSGTSFIPSIRNHFSPELGFGFRINLALDSPLFRASLKRLLNKLCMM